MNKAIRIFTLPLLLSSFLVSCANQGEKETDSLTSSEQTGEAIALNVYEAVDIPTKYLSSEGKAQDETIAKVVGDKIIGLSGGETVVTFAGKSETLSVKVSDTGDVPFLSLKESSLSLFSGDTYKISPSLIYKGKEVEASFSYKVFDTSIASITSEGKLTALKEGKSEVSVFASYYGLEAENYPFLASSFTLEIFKASSALLSVTSTNLYTLDCVLGSKNFASEATLSGVYGDESGTSDLLKKDLTWVISDPSVLSVTDNKVKALKKGKAEVYATFDGGETNHLNFVVDKPYYETSVEGFYDSHSKTLDLDYSSLWQGGDEEALAIYDEEDPEKNILKEDGSLAFGKLGERKWTVEGKTYNYKVGMTSVSKVINTSTELTSMLLYGSNKKMTDYGYMSMEGYFILGNDIDMKGGALRSILGLGNGASLLESSGFLGTFDGRGHTIKNASVSANNGGLFGTLANQSVIKNLALQDIEIKGASGALTSYLGGTIENVYVKGKISYTKGTSSLYSSLLANKIDASGKVRNVVVEYTNSEASTPFASALGYLDGEASENCFENTYVIGTETRVFATAKKNAYVGFSTDKNGAYATYSSFKESAKLSTFGDNWTFDSDGINFHA